MRVPLEWTPKKREARAITFACAYCDKRAPGQIYYGAIDADQFISPPAGWLVGVSDPILTAACSLDCINRQLAKTRIAMQLDKLSERLLRARP